MVEPHQEDLQGIIEFVSATGLKVERREDAQTLLDYYRILLKTAAQNTNNASEMILGIIEAANGFNQDTPLSISAEQIAKHGADTISLLNELGLPIAAILEQQLREETAGPRSIFAEVIQASFGADVLRNFEEQIGAEELNLTLAVDQRFYVERFFSWLTFKSIVNPGAEGVSLAMIGSGLELLEKKLQLRLTEMRERNSEREVVSEFWKLAVLTHNFFEIGIKAGKGEPKVDGNV